MQFTETLRARHSVRHFESTPIDEALLKAIVEDATRAPSWVNAQEWDAWILTGEKLEGFRREFSELVKAKAPGLSEVPATPHEMFSETSQENMRLFNKAREEAGLALVKLAAQQELFYAPAVCFLTLPKTYTPYMMFDLGAFAQTLMLSAASRGVGSVVAWNPVRYPEALRKYLPIPTTRAIAIAVALGYEKPCALNDFRSTRRSTSEILKIVR